jgi:hypothetical protein
MGSVTTASRTFGANVSEPCTTSTIRAKTRTPHPKTGAKVSAAMKSRALLRARSQEVVVALKAVLEAPDRSQGTHTE